MNKIINVMILFLHMTVTTPGRIYRKVVHYKSVQNNKISIHVI